MAPGTIEFDAGEIDVDGRDVEPAQELDEPGLKALDGDDAVDAEALQMAADARKTRDFALKGVEEHLVVVVEAIVLDRVDEGDVVAEIGERFARKEQDAVFLLPA